MDTFTKFEQDIVYLQLWAPLKIKIFAGVQTGILCVGFKLEYFVSRFERKLIYLQLWVPLKIVVLGGAQIDNLVGLKVEFSDTT